MFIQYNGHAEEKEKWVGEIEDQEYCGSIESGKEKEKAMVILGS